MVPRCTRSCRANPAHCAARKEPENRYSLESAKVFYTTPGVPQDRVDFLRETFDKIVADKGFVKQAKLRWTVWEPPVSGAEHTETVRATMAISQEDIAALLESINKMAAL